MLRLVLDYFSRNRDLPHKLSFMDDSRWYSELLLPSPFKPRSKGDKLGEGYTHADGVIGHFTIQNHGKGDIKLEKTVKQFKVIEAKMYSPLSKGTSNCSYYNQAARNVACMAEVIRQTDKNIGPINISSLDLAFYVLAPEGKKKEITSILKLESIKKCVEQRVNDYKGQSEYQDKKAWFDKHFLPVSKKIEIKFISWESILGDVEKNDKELGNSLQEFYEKCKKYN